MLGEIALAAVAVAVAYLLGSFPSAYVVGRLFKGVDMREVGDGRMGAAETYRRVGLVGGVIAAAIDVGKGAAAVLIAQRLGLPLPLVVSCGVMVVVGHNWSALLRFKGGKGALTTYGVLLTLMFWQFFLSMLLVSVIFGMTRKTGLCTGILFGVLAVSNLLLGNSVWLVLLPILIAVPMVLKHVFMPKPETEALADLESPLHKRG